MVISREVRANVTSQAIRQRGKKIVLEFYGTVSVKGYKNRG